MFGDCIEVQRRVDSKFHQFPPELQATQESSHYRKYLCSKSHDPLTWEHGVWRQHCFTLDIITYQHVGTPYEQLNHGVGLK